MEYLCWGCGLLVRDEGDSETITLTIIATHESAWCFYPCENGKHNSLLQHLRHNAIHLRSKSYAFIGSLVLQNYPGSKS